MAKFGFISSFINRLTSMPHRYSAIPPDHTEPLPLPSHTTSVRRRFCSRTMVRVSGAVLLLSAATIGYSLCPSTQKGCEENGNCTAISKHTWGQYSPYFAAPSELSSSVPDGCKVTFVQILSRHGSRSPTSDKAQVYDDLLQSLRDNVTDYAQGYEFIKDYTPPFVPDELTPYGENELVTAGTSFAKRYSSLTQDKPMFIRASGSHRVIVSAEKFAQGFYSDTTHSDDILVISEEPGSNNTLDHGGCSAFEDGDGKKLGKKKQKEWMAKFVPTISDRLTKKLSGSKLDAQSVVYLMDLCPFDTITDPSAKLSPFCQIFNQDEWLSYDYYQSLEKWYVYGPGRKLAPTQGVGYVNELIARMTGQPVQDHTTTNTTLDSSEKTFPLDRKLYADFTHDNTMMTIYGALGLFKTTQNLPTDRRLSPRELDGYSSSRVVSFAARMVVEKMVCDGQGDEELVRLLINDRVFPLKDCNADSLGRCKLGAFVKSQSFSQSGGDWAQCDVKEK